MLTTVTDGDGNTTTITRNAGSDPTAIVSADGQATALALDANGYMTTNKVDYCLTGNATDSPKNVQNILDTALCPRLPIH